MNRNETFEILDHLPFKLQGGILIVHKHGAEMLREGRDTVHLWFTPSSMALCRANALWAPVMWIVTSSIHASAHTHHQGYGGHMVRSPSKSLALPRMMSMAPIFKWALDTRLEPGSLKTMCLSGSMPPTNSAFPPVALIFSSKASLSTCRSAII